MNLLARAQSSFIIFCVLTGIAGAYDDPFNAPLKPLPDASPSPPPPDWSLVFLPESDWTPKEARQAAKLLSRIQPDLVIASQRFKWLKSYQIDHPGCRVRSINDPAEPTAPPPTPSWSFQDATVTLPLSLDDSAPAHLLWLRTSWTKQRKIGPNPSGAESEAIMAARCRQAFSEMSGDVVFLFKNAPELLVEKHGHGWFLYQKQAGAETQVARAIVLDWSHLAPWLPARAGATARTPLFHLITGDSKSINWDILPADGNPALWHWRTIGFSAKNPRIFVRPPNFDRPPVWMDAYVADNPALCPGAECSTKRKKGARLLWKKMGGDTPVGFPDLRFSNAQPKGDIDPIRLPKDAVRSPSCRFALLPNRYGPNGQAIYDGDDGVGIDIGDLKTKKCWRLYYAGISSPWPVGATWFTDRYLIVSGSFSGGGSLDDLIGFHSEEMRSIFGHANVISFRLYDLWTGNAYYSRMLMETSPSLMNFTERIIFPGDYWREIEFWPAVWSAVERSLAPVDPPPPPFAPAKASELLGLGSPGDADWSFLGPWPPPESWEPIGTDDCGPHPPRIGDPLLTMTSTFRPFYYYYADPYGASHPGGAHQIRLDIQSFGPKESYTSDRQPVARAPLMKTGGGLLPRLTSVHRCTDSMKRILLLGGYAPIPGPKGGRMQWILMLDTFSHRGWKLTWNPNTPRTDSGNQGK